ncbi:MAG: GTP-dependent dephospho-CoA kinase family protein [Candidatus Altiarchaeota archaeon]
MKLKISEKTRKKLKRFSVPIVKNLRNLNLKDKLIICIGDETSREILKLGIKPKICVYDCKIMRKEIPIPDEIKNFNAKEIEVRNPAGEITEELYNAIKKSLQSNLNVKIHVIGEEDLSALAAINLAPLNSLVLYGQPKKGVAVVEVNEKIKKRVNKILEDKN